MAKIYSIGEHLRLCAFCGNTTSEVSFRGRHVCAHCLSDFAAWSRHGEEHEHTPSNGLSDGRRLTLLTVGV